MERELAPHRALYHPLWLVSLGLLVLNDHFLKGSGILPAVITGKLSDFAGLLVAPALLAVLLRLSTRRAFVVANVATGAVFAGIKIFPVFARVFEAIAGLGPFAWHITVDPTDLVAVPVLFISYRVFVNAMQRPLPERPMTQRGLVMAGSVACMATSQPTEPFEPCPDPIACGAIPREQAALVIGNDTDAQRLMRVRPLKDSVQYLCSDLLADPTRALSRELFGPADAWLLEPNRGLPLLNKTSTNCVAYLVDADGLSPTLIAWSTLEFPENFVSTSTLAPEGNTMINLSLDANGKLALADHPAVFEAPALEEVQPTGACAPTDPGVGIAWSTPLPGAGPFKVVSVESSPDDCHMIVLENSPSMFICVPAAAMPFQAGDLLEVEPVTISGGSFAETNGEAPIAEGVRLRSGTHIVLALRGNVLARYGNSGAIEQLTEPTVEVDRASGCAGSHDKCGSLTIPAEIAYMGDHVNTITFLRAGSSLALKDGYGTLHVVRADATPIRDTACPPFARASQHYESVLVVPTIP
ncbi:MAG: hypothetical protein IPM54_07865 [Polyangiaceae bacterium]|nr:hypothetical protein [Polyangiaceae bacterium]